MAETFLVHPKKISSSPGHGGARPGAGRPRKTQVLGQAPKPVAPVIEEGTPGAFLLERMRDESIEMKLRLDAAKALLPYCHARMDAPSKAAASDQAALTAQVGSPWDGLIQ